ncbi:MAG: Ldh family oxidoreductase [Acidobacteriia bacterium]|nr:Ldh family oxidoreductase [Terriglobia bacterium]
MPEYPGTEHERRIAPEALTRQVAAIFAGCGMSREDAGWMAESLVMADLRGVHSHGVLRVPEYVEKLLAKGVDPRGRPRIVKDNGAALVIDGGNSMGQIGAAFAMRHAIERARTANLGAAAVRGSNHCGAMFSYAMMALAEDMIGIATTNALPTMAPWGGKDKIVGINPLAVAIPAGKEAPIVLDAAFSYSSHGKIRVFQQKGYPIPSTWSFDEEGAPTTDTTKAIAGLLRPIGEYKGVGLAIVMGILASLLSGAGYGLESGNMVEGAIPGKDGHFFLAIRVAAFEEPRIFRRRVDGIIGEIRSSRPVDPLKEHAQAGAARRDPASVLCASRHLYAPGGLEAETEARYRREGIPLNAETLSGLGAAEQRAAGRGA